MGILEPRIIIHPTIVVDSNNRKKRASTGSGQMSHTQSTAPEASSVLPLVAWGWPKGQTPVSISNRFQALEVSDLDVTAVTPPPVLNGHDILGMARRPRNMSHVLCPNRGFAHEPRIVSK